MLKEKANFIARKIDDNIFKIEKDRKGHYSGQVYINTQQLIDVLNNELSIVVYDKDGSKLINTVPYESVAVLKEIETILTPDQIKKMSNPNNKDISIAVNINKMEDIDIDNMIEEIAKNIKDKLSEIKYY